MVLRAGFHGTVGQSSAQVIDGSLKFDDDNKNYLTRTPDTAGNNKTFTFSTWTKGLGNGTFFCNGVASTGDNGLYIMISSGSLYVGTWTTSWQWYVDTNRLFRDDGWYHLVVSVDTTQSTNTDRVKLYVNGVQETSFATANYPSQNYNTLVNNTAAHAIGRQGELDNHYIDKKLSQVYFIDGLQLGPENFGFTDPLTNTWRPKKYTGSVNAPESGFGGTVWSSYVTNGSTGGTAPSKAFNGDIANNSGYSETNWTRSASNGNTPAVFDVSGVASMADVTEVKVYVYVADSQNNGTILAVNDVNQATSGLSGFQVFTVDVTGNGLDTIKYKYVSGSGPYCYLTGVTVSINGGAHQELIDGSGAAAGVNGFYLPMDGNSPIGQDKSGNGNNWTPVNFGGSNSIEKATGALPILNTTSGGTSATVGVRSDTYSTYLTLALPLTGISPDVSHKINSGSTAKTVSISGDPASSTLQSNFYGASFYFDGSATSDYVSVADNDQLDVGSGDFTIECWAYVSGYPNNNPGLLSKRGGNGAAHWQLVLNRNGQIQFGDQATWSNYFGTSSGTSGDQIFKDQWHHIAITRTSGSVQAWYDGRKYGTAITNNTDFSTSANFSVGVGRENNHDPFQGYVNDVRVYKGVAKYTDSFVPASTNPTILPDTPSGVSGGSKLTKTSGSFGNSNSGLRAFGNISVADSADLEFGSGNFTMEAFIYIDGTPGTGSATYTICSKWQNRSAPTDKGYIWRIAGSNLEFFWTTDGSSNNNVTGTAGKLGANRWYHVAVVRNGTTGTFYIDGEADPTTISFGSATIRDTGNPFRIGSNTGDPGGNIDQEFNGLISNVRVLKGTALYTSNFTPPSEPLTNIANTKILACQDSDYNVVGYTTTTATGASPIFKTTDDYGEIYGDGNLNADPNASNLVLCLDFYANATDRMPAGRPSNQKSLSAGGNPSPGNTRTSHFYGKSAHFDGNDQYSISSSADFSFDGQFCIEMWANASNWGPFFVSGGTNGIWLGSTASGLVIRRYGVQNDILVQLPPFNEWVHLAFTRDSSNVLRLFINGEEQAMSYVNFTYTQNTLYIGSDGAGGNYTGYIQDLRVYKGIAKYTSDFNPPFRSLNKVKAAVSPSQFRHTKLAGGPVAFNPFNTDINTVRGQETGYATWNPLSNGTNAILDGNLTLGVDSSSGNSRVNCTMSVSSGKWYYECYVLGSGSDFNSYGVSVGPEITNQFPGFDANSWGFEFGRGQGKHSNTYSYAYTAIAAGDTFMCAFDVDTKKLWFGRNGVWQVGDPGSGTNAFYDISNATHSDYRPAGRPYGAGSLVRTNFGQTPFKFPPPDGFLPLNAANIRPETVITRPDQYVKMNTWTGNGSTQTIEGLEFSPDVTLIKARTGNAYHVFFDVLRGTNKRLAISPSNAGEADEGVNGVSAFGTNSFTVTDNSAGDYNVNGSAGGTYAGSTGVYVGLAWKAGGSKGTFNVDDVGYANASDVNMSVDALSNKTQNWSGNATGGQNVGRAFDGTGPRKDHYSHTSGSLTVNFSPAISGRIIVYGGAGGSGARIFTLSDGSSLSSDVVYDTAPYYSTLDFGVKSNITSLTCSNGYTLYGISLDGKMLVDSGSSVNVPSIPTTGCSVGTKQGFSVIKYTGNNTQHASVAHGLNSPIDFMIVKRYNGSGGWAVGSNALDSWGKVLYLSDTGNAYTQPEPFNATAPTDSIFRLYDSSSTNANGGNYIAYCWHNVPGLQKFGRYEGNESTNGPYVELGFRPAVLLVKNADENNHDWKIYDGRRNPHNPVTQVLYLNLSNGEDANTGVDFLANGFKWRDSGSAQNGAETIIYAAWAEASAFNLYGGQSNAR